MEVSVTPGRIRLRNKALKAEELAYTLRDQLLEVRGVVQVQINKRIGSILILFDKAKTNAEKILCDLAGVLGIDREKIKKTINTITGKKARQYVKQGMLVTLGIGLGAALFSEKWHIAFGLVFTKLVALHLYQNRRTLMK